MKVDQGPLECVTKITADFDKNSIRGVLWPEHRRRD